MCTSSEKSPESHRIVNTNGAAIQVTDRGAGERALVFLHYWGGSSRTWQDVILGGKPRAIRDQVEHEAALREVFARFLPHATSSSRSGSGRRQLFAGLRDAQHFGKPEGESR